ncbi:acyl-CoA thioesterase [Mangrovivirga sp. M17]|uniref:Acyl-CoA thioesterase n=1 Tax=Mangrovivirga halotolerans TaxID=2993936 RepID=A0ABT3RQH9_9BACT|nr:acyl-CoA thioesterase [Mangrovivirga halotolerans]MCX2743593.1 acyl-CoA thioesterase [Mangrovivirga halotolerans]
MPENQLEPRSVKFSATTITELMLPSSANFGGKIHGGYLLSMMDKVAYACSSKHSGAYCVTVSVNAVDFLLPVEVGDLVSMLASVNYVGNTSMVVGIKVIAENVKTGEVKHTNTSYFTMVAKNEQGETVKVPPLLLESPIDVRRFVESIKRRKLKKQISEKMDEEKKTFDLKKELTHLKDQRCILADDLQ